MEVIKIRSRWRENAGFKLERRDIGDEYIFIQFLTPAELLLEGEWVFVQEGSCIMYNKHSAQYMRSNGVLIHNWMHIKGNLDEICQAYGFKYNTVYNTKNSNAISNVVREMEEEFLVCGEFKNRLAELKIEELIIKTVRESNLKSQINQINSDMVRSFLAFRIKMNREYQKDWTVPEMAKQTGYSQARFCKLYKEIFGISPKRDLQLVRIEQAKLLLIQNEYMVSTVAQMCGYTNPFHFIRTFKKETGMTPGEYKGIYIAGQ